MSMTTTSASCRSAIPRATVAPTFPAPPTTVTLRFIGYSALRRSTQNSQKPQNRVALRVQRVLRCTSSHVLNHCVPELGGADFGRIVHQAGEVVGDPFGGDGPVHALYHQVGRLGPAEMPEHHLAREHNRARVHLVQIGIFWRRAVRRL